MSMVINVTSFEPELFMSKSVHRLLKVTEKDF